MNRNERTIRVTMKIVIIISIQLGTYFSLAGRYQLKQMMLVFNLFSTIPITAMKDVILMRFLFLSRDPMA